MPHFPTYNFFGQPFPNFSVKNDRVLDNLRVKQPNTFKCPPATKNIIDPNILVPNPDQDPEAPPDISKGSNDPAVNDTLQNN